MKNQRRFAPTGGQFTPESVASFIGICTNIGNKNLGGKKWKKKNLKQSI